jgi:hypothetical protein
VLAINVGRGRPEGMTTNMRFLSMGKSIMALAVMAILLQTLFATVAAFTVVDHAMCEDIDSKTYSCNERSNEFPPTGNWAYFWFKGTFQSSDVGESLAIAFYDANGAEYAVNNYLRDNGVTVAGPGDIVMFMGVGITEAKAQDGLYVASAKLSLSKIGATISGGGFISTPYELQQPAISKLGEWRAEFLLGGKTVLSERFIILGKATTSTAILSTTSTPPETTTGEGTVTIVTGEAQPNALGLPSSLLIVVVVVVILSVTVGYVYARRKRTS